jgi:hypothetical protein
VCGAARAASVLSLPLSANAFLFVTFRRAVRRWRRCLCVCPLLPFLLTAFLFGSHFWMQELLDRRNVTCNDGCYTHSFSYASALHPRRLPARVRPAPLSRAAGLAMAFKLIESAQDHWRVVNAPHLVALVRAGATFINGKLVERPGGEAQSEAA